MTERVVKSTGFVCNPLNAIFHWLDELQVEAEAGAEEHGPLRGPVEAAQRPWSIALDQLAAEREEAA